MKRRVVRDSVNVVLIDDARNLDRMKPSRTTRSLRRRRNIDVEVESHEVTSEDTKPWE